MSDPLVQAATPALIASLQAIQGFVTNIGPDPAQWALKVPGAVQVMLGNIALQLPSLAVAEGAALQSEVNAKLAAWIKNLQGS